MTGPGRADRWWGEGWATDRAGGRRGAASRLVAVLAAAVAVAGGGLAFAGYEGIGPLAPRLGVVVTRAVPESVMGPGSAGDPLTVTILFPWPHDGFCSGQFTVSATETDRVVRVSDVTSREVRRGSCAGLGTTDGTAGVGLTLDRPLGERVVVREGDGVALAVVLAG